MTAPPVPAEAPPPRRERHADWSALAALFALTVRQHTHGRRLLVLALLYVVPCGLAILLRNLARPAPADAIEFALILVLLPHGLAPLTALLYAAGVVSDEVEEQTLTYLLLRSIPRWELFLTKLIATWCVTATLVGCGVLALYASIYLGADTFWTDVLPRAGGMVAIAATAQFGYCALFGFLGLATRRSLVAGVAYIVAVEGVIANLDFVGRALSAVYYVRTLTLRQLNLPAEQLRRCQESWGMVEMDKLPSSAESVLVIVGLGAVIAVGSALWFARSEFHVKTPGSD